MKIIIHGAGGHMGQIVKDMIEKGGNHQITGLFDPMSDCCQFIKDYESFNGEADMIIDFSHHLATERLLKYAADKKLPLVLATTGHTEEEKALITAASSDIPIFYTGNLSLGVAVLTKLVKEAVAWFPDADVEIIEMHHNRKLDVPSGTALMLGKAVQEARPEAELLTGRHENGKRTKEEVGIHSVRMGNTVGIHEVIINTGTQLLTLRHDAQDRGLFAEGAIRAAEFLKDKEPGLYNMDNLMN